MRNDNAICAKVFLATCREGFIFVYIWTLPRSNCEWALSTYTSYQREDLWSLLRYQHNAKRHDKKPIGGLGTWNIPFHLHYPKRAVATSRWWRILRYYPCSISEWEWPQESTWLYVPGQIFCTGIINSHFPERVLDTAQLNNSNSWRKISTGLVFPFLKRSVEF